MYACSDLGFVVSSATDELNYLLFILSAIRKHNHTSSCTWSVYYCVTMCGLHG